MKILLMIAMFFSANAIYSAATGSVSRTVGCENTNNELCFEANSGIYWNKPVIDTGIPTEVAMALLTPTANYDGFGFIFKNGSTTEGDGYINIIMDEYIPNNFVFISDENTEIFSNYSAYQSRLIELGLISQ